MYDALLNKAGAIGVFTDFPDLGVQFLENQKIRNKEIIERLVVTSLSFYIILKLDLFDKILYNKLNKNLKGGIFYDSN